MRVFIAVEISESIRSTIVQIQGKLGRTEDKIKWVDPPLIHLTLKFLGEVRKERLGAVIEVAQKIAPKFSPFFMEVKRVVLFLLPPLPELYGWEWIGGALICKD